jgi:tripartite-type tricarboxylate transporter receptor subunit TctC
MRKTSKFMAVSALLFTAVCATAQDYPNRPVKVIVPYPAGGGLDMMCRTVVDKVATAMGQPFVVDNRAGGSGAIGAGIVAKAPADGYTIMCGNNSEITLLPLIIKGLLYDAERDFAPLTMAVKQTVVLVANASVPVMDAKELIALTRKTPLSYGHTGVGGTIHIAIEQFSADGKVPFVHVPYKGAAPLMNDLLAGHVPLTALNLAPLSAYIREKKLRPLVVFQTERHPMLPDVPTAREVIGVDVISHSWFGFTSPAKVPADIRARLDKELQRALSDPAVKAKLSAVHMEVVGMPADAFADYQRKERAYFAGLIKRFDYKAD